MRSSYGTISHRVIALCEVGNMPEKKIGGQHRSKHVRPPFCQNQKAEIILVRWFNSESFGFN
jgi:hypothetical protein